MAAWRLTLFPALCFSSFSKWPILNEKLKNKCPFRIRGMPFRVGQNEGRPAPHMMPGKCRGIRRAAWKSFPRPRNPAPLSPPSESIRKGTEVRLGGAGLSLTCNSEKLRRTYMPKNRGFEFNVIAHPRNEMLHSCWNDAQMCPLSWKVL